MTAHGGGCPVHCHQSLDEGAHIASLYAEPVQVAIAAPILAEECLEALTVFDIGLNGEVGIVTFKPHIVFKFYEIFFRH